MIYYDKRLKVVSEAKLQVNVGRIVVSSGIEPRKPPGLYFEFVASKNFLHVARHVVGLPSSVS
jgi:hypothetical protein